MTSTETTVQPTSGDESLAIPDLGAPESGRSPMSVVAPISLLTLIGVGVLVWLLFRRRGERATGL